MLILYEEDHFPIGKYKHKTVGEVAVEDPEYIIWWQNNKDVAISDEITDNLNINEEQDNISPFDFREIE